MSSNGDKTDTVPAVFHRTHGVCVMAAETPTEPSAGWVGVSHSTGTLIIALAQPDGSLVAAALSREASKIFALSLAAAMEQLVDPSGRTLQ